MLPTTTCCRLTFVKYLYSLVKYFYSQSSCFTICVTCSTAESENGIITANDTAPPPTANAPSAPLHPSVTWPTPSGINETEGRRICQSPIVESPVYDTCSDYTDESLEFITTSCMLDLLVHIYILSVIRMT